MLHTRHTSRADVELTLPEAREGKAGCRPARRPYRWAFPEMTRPQTGTRGLSIALRTLHLASFGILLGGHAFAIESNQLLPALYLTIASGAGLIALEVYIIGLYWLFLGKGVMVFLKLAMLLAVPFFWDHRLLLLLLVVVIASVGSHMPARYRHYSFLHRRVVQAGESLRIVSSSKDMPDALKGQ